uniref:Uncharacterized protein n=1 Tax=Aegilops tauschii subsp. strangulata TaxID=200361 RepID=A0A453F985_AEGTS
MGAPKQKWTSEEEEALRRGVLKHGAGKWRTIQKDPEFSPVLSSRSNIDLKDKWRNLSFSASGLGSRDKQRVPRPKAPSSSPSPSPQLLLLSAPNNVAEASPPEDCEKSPQDDKTPSPKLSYLSHMPLNFRYKTYTFKRLLILEDKHIVLLIQYFYSRVSA